MWFWGNKGTTSIDSSTCDWHTFDQGRLWLVCDFGLIRYHWIEINVSMFQFILACQCNKFFLSLYKWVRSFLTNSNIPSEYRASIQIPAVFFSKSIQWYLKKVKVKDKLPLFTKHRVAGRPPNIPLMYNLVLWNRFLIKKIECSIKSKFLKNYVFNSNFLNITFIIKNTFLAVFNTPKAIFH